jgi:hypothetical protein
MRVLPVMHQLGDARGGLQGFGLVVGVVTDLEPGRGLTLFKNTAQSRSILLGEMMVMRRIEAIFVGA